MKVAKSTLVKELTKRTGQAASAKAIDLLDQLSPPQYAFVMDKSPSKVAVCSRRAGKTIACAWELIMTSLETPDVVCLYVTLSRNNAKKIIWRELKKINKTFKLGAEENLSELSFTFPNGSVIYLSGAKDTSEIEKFRGLALKLVYIDEAQSFREYIKELIDDVLAPALMDYSGTLALIGTPGPVPVGFFAEAAGAVAGQETKAWPANYHWTFWENPYIVKKSKKTHQEMLERELLRRGVSLQDPSIQREWFGKWVLDADSLLLHYSADKNDFSALPSHITNWNYILGVDLGFRDADALAVLAWSPNTPNTYLIDECVTTKQGITELVQQIEAMSKKYDISKMVIDAGGLGKKIAEEMRRQHKIPIQDADKTLKMQNVAFLDDALRSGRLKAKSSSFFAQDCFLVEIDREKTRPDKLVVSNKYHSDIIDAVLYAFKESPAFAYAPPEKKIVRGTKEWAEQQSNAMFEAAQQHFEELADLQKRIDGLGWPSDD